MPLECALKKSPTLSMTLLTHFFVIWPISLGLRVTQEEEEDRRLNKVKGCPSILGARSDFLATCAEAQIVTGILRI